MNRRAPVVAVLVALLAACGPEAPTAGPTAVSDCPSGGGTAVIEWIDFVKFADITYTTDSVYGAQPSGEDVGRVFAETRCKLADVVSDPGYESRNGDAAFLQPGTPLHVLEGYEPWFRLVARRDGRWTIYEAQTVPGADRGSDLLDIEEKVAYIGVNSIKDGRTEIAAIRDRDEVKRLVEMVLEAPVDQGRRPPDYEDRERRFVAFQLSDGTATARALFPTTGLLWRGIIVPREFVDAIEAAVDRRGK